MENMIKEIGEEPESYRKKRALVKERGKEGDSGQVSGLTEGKNDRDEEVDLMLEFETDVYMRSCGAIPREADPWSRPVSFAHGVTAYQAVADADKTIKRHIVIRSKKA